MNAPLAYTCTDEVVFSFRIGCIGNAACRESGYLLSLRNVVDRVFVKPISLHPALLAANIRPEMKQTALLSFEI